MDMQMGNFHRMMHKMSRKAERMWHRFTNKMEKKIDIR